MTIRIRDKAGGIGEGTLDIDLPKLRFETKIIFMQLKGVFEKMRHPDDSPPKLHSTRCGGGQHPLCGGFIYWFGRRRHCGCPCHA